MDISGKTALLTGGLGSLGRAQAARLVEVGVAVTILERPDIEEGAARAAALRAAWLPCDLNDLAKAQRVVADAATAVGGFDILINNAALIINRPFEEFSIQEYEDQIRVNSSAAFALTIACAPSMKQKRWGKIVNFTSITLRGMLDGYVPYIASKGAMLGLTKSLARELGPHGICVNAVAPGAIASEAEERVFGHKAAEYSEWVIEHQSLKVRIRPDAVAELVLFPVSPASDMITGQNVGIDGGW